MNFKKGDRIKRVGNKAGGNLWFWPIGESGVVTSADPSSDVFVGRADGTAIDYLYISGDFEAATASFKVGDKLRCLAWNGFSFKPGEVYTVSENPFRAGVLGCCCAVGNFVAKPWDIPDGMVKFELVSEIAAIPITMTFIAPKQDRAEAALMSRWLAVPRGCCKHCGPSVPLPCAYHPADKAGPVDDDIGF